MAGLIDPLLRCITVHPVNLLEVKCREHGPIFRLRETGRWLCSGGASVVDDPIIEVGKGPIRVAWFLHLKVLTSLVLFSPATPSRFVSFVGVERAILRLPEWGWRSVYGYVGLRKPSESASIASWWQGPQGLKIRARPQAEKRIVSGTCLVRPSCSTHKTSVRIPYRHIQHVLRDAIKRVFKKIERSTVNAKLDIVTLES